MNPRILNCRASGILLPVTSLPSIFGIGDLGPAAYRFVDFLAAAHQRYWQILPLTPIDPAFGNSPYSTASAFAVNPLLISPELLLKEGYLKEGDLKSIPKFLLDKTDYDSVIVYKSHLLERAFEHFQKSQKNSTSLEGFAKFCLENQLWLEDYVLFVVLKEHFQGKIWSAWPEEFCHRKPAALSKVKKRFAKEIFRVKFFQYVFFKQWAALKSYAREKGIQFIGDIPIYVNYDGADVWRDPQLFKLDRDLNPLYAAGVPPDYFGKTGQRWGNPVYDWQRLKETHYRWWIDRVRHNLKLFDCARIDHFRGFIAYWEIPAGEETAVNGRWVNVPYEDFFKTILLSFVQPKSIDSWKTKRNTDHNMILVKEKSVEKFSKLSLIAEDLGVITPEVTSAMNRFGFPGMKVLLFAFDGNPSENPYMPENHIKNCVVYTGTHDNNTVRGWFEYDISKEEKKNLWNYFENPNAENISQLFVTMAMESAANTVIIPMQDLLGLGQEARMNIPGTVRGNWQWRLKAELITDRFAKEILKLTKHSRRDTATP